MGCICIGGTAHNYCSRMCSVSEYLSRTEQYWGNEGRVRCSESYGTTVAIAYFGVALSDVNSVL